MSFRPTWAEVSLGRLKENFRALRRHIGPGPQICAVVKADAYGHGGLECARSLEAEGAKWFGVTSTDEGILLREGGISGRILLMTGFWRGDQDDVVRYQLTPAVWEHWQIELLETAAQRVGASAVPVHIKVDTGMTRLGVSTADLPGLCHRIANSKQLAIEGVFSHLASAEVLDAEDAAKQIAEFEKLLSGFAELNIAPTYIHMANSAAIVARPETWKNMVRPGLALYGYCTPIRGGRRTAQDVPPVELQPVLSWKTRVLSLRDVCAGRAIGYNATYITHAPARLAILPVGYADGLDRQLSSLGRVLIRGQYAPIVGIVSMDLTIVDVSGIAGVEVGDEVVILGTSERATINAWEYARLCATIPYEVLCRISKRVPRRYIE
ncbi:MAG TPA: alanine racemase [Terriglobales bacterium]|nr:alanine racemase [Terriglobales bacterium]